MTWKIPLFKLHSDSKDINAVSRIIKSGMNWATGDDIVFFERELAAYAGVKYAVSFSSGTAALHALLLALHIGKGDEVIVPSFTFISTANAVLFVGATPVFAEIERETFGLDYKDVERKITKKTKAIIPVHIGGLACKIEELKRVAEKHKLLLIEDAAESLGATIKGKKVGSFGCAGMISLCGPKVISTGEGGAIVTDSRDIYEQLRLLRSHGRADTKDYFKTTEYLDYIQLGYNFRLSNILAALGRTQLKKIEKLITARRKNSAYLSQQLKNIHEISVPTEPKNNRHIFQMYIVRVGGGKNKRDALQKHLNEKGIMAKVYFPPVHLSQFYKSKGFKKGHLPETEAISNEVLTLPMFPTLTKHEMDFMAKEIKAFFHE
ncbi:aminotransferase DegT [Candidatus Nomurabacteria bacterium RIFCSPHIGHO2_01_FULL_42_15]|uniref:Aminotransferase DegT n=1 Tax=Candidatus Nomurabacteria bacterium RIFCSPHIGHO2_01_FULL_42_15 TaxID=1801742 RepID=A0A1F6VE87_9BACT|nr:MAG: aminotransferase DegT [Candidatus Nomurabacteria bacterium RIFCSPHIGHO2_01_FULL_42_15]OGI93355.1 MAG: aminotransferase DegT [Candidatus Nomurabacteria bacterium RIFCSPLOWO2_01_FULL_41_18]